MLNSFSEKKRKERNYPGPPDKGGKKVSSRKKKWGCQREKKQDRPLTGTKERTQTFLEKMIRSSDKKKSAPSRRRVKKKRRLKGEDLVGGEGGRGGYQGGPPRFV